MWKALAFKMIQKLIESWMSQEVGPKLGVPVAVRGGDDPGQAIQDCLDAAKADPALAAQAGGAGQPGGILEQLQTIYAAFQATPKNWPAIWASVQALMTHL